MNYKRKSPFRYTFSEPITVYFKIVNINGKRIETSEGTASMIDLSPKGMKLKSSLDLQNINHKTIFLSIRFTELPEREGPLLQMWDESEVKSSVSSDTLMI